MDNKEAIRKQIQEAAGNVCYTYIAHWEIVDRDKAVLFIIKLTQIVLTALTAGGFLSTILNGVSKLSWIGGAISLISLGLNLFLLNFKLPDIIEDHYDAANELWDVREAYISLLNDFDLLELDEVREKRDNLTKEVSRINKTYLGTDKRSFKKAQNNIGKYTYENGEAAQLLGMKDNQQ